MKKPSPDIPNIKVPISPPSPKAPHGSKKPKQPQRPVRQSAYICLQIKKAPFIMGNSSKKYDKGGIILLNLFNKKNIINNYSFLFQKEKPSRLATYKGLIKTCKRIISC